MAQNDTGGQLDPGLSSLLAQMMAGSGITGMASPEDILQETMLGMSGRQGLTAQPLTGILPRWFKANPAMVALVQRGQVDPYLPTNDPASWRVYVGTPKTVRAKVGPTTNSLLADPATPKSLRGDETELVNSVTNQPFLWEEDQVAEAIKKFQDAGLTSVTDFDSMHKAWGGLVQRAGAMYSLSSGQRKVTPWDVLDLYKTEMQKAGTSGGSGGGSPSTVTQTSRSVSSITHGDGWSALQNTLSRMLGRDPSEEEVRDFVGRMNHIAAKNPTITRSTTSGIGTGNQSTSSRTKAGFNSNDILENAYKDAQADDDYAEFQSASTYFNAALSALGAIGG
jgi:hypothetical protein